MITGNISLLFSNIKLLQIAVASVQFGRVICRGIISIQAKLQNHLQAKLQNHFVM